MSLQLIIKAWVGAHLVMAENLDPAPLQTPLQTPQQTALPP